MCVIVLLFLLSLWVFAAIGFMMVHWWWVCPLLLLGIINTGVQEWLIPTIKERRKRGVSNRNKARASD